MFRIDYGIYSELNSACLNVFRIDFRSIEIGVVVNNCAVLIIDTHKIPLAKEGFFYVYMYTFNFA